MLLDGIVSGRFPAFGDARMMRGGALSRIFRKKPAFRKTSGPFREIEGEEHGVRFRLVKPETYVNDTGRAIASLQTRGVFRSLSELLVVFDEVDLEVGSVRLRARGSSGGHNGMKSIIGQLGTGDFPRLRIGVGPRPDGADLVDYVLSSFTPAEYERFEQSLELASRVVGTWITEGIESAYNVLS